MSWTEPSHSSAILVKFENLKVFGTSKDNFKKKFNAKGMDIHCDNCGVDGHAKDACFKLHAFRDRYKDLEMKISKPASKVIANLVDTPFDKQQDSVKNKASK